MSDFLQVMVGEVFVCFRETARNDRFPPVSTSMNEYMEGKVISEIFPDSKTAGHVCHGMSFQCCPQKKEAFLTRPPAFC